MEYSGSVSRHSILSRDADNVLLGGGVRVRVRVRVQRKFKGKSKALLINKSCSLA